MSMDDHEWIDPLLITDVYTQEKLTRRIHETVNQSSSSKSPAMEEADPDDLSPTSIHDSSQRVRRSEGIYAEKSCDPDAENIFDGRSMLGFSLASPDLVICTGSPDIPAKSCDDSPKFLKDKSTVVSLENGMKGDEPNDSVEAERPAEYSAFWKEMDEHTASPESNFELPLPPFICDESPEITTSSMSINAGLVDVVAFHAGEEFSQDEHFTRSYPILTDMEAGDSEGLDPCLTAECGDWTYNFKTIGPGFYTVDLHLAEISFTEDSLGKTFDVFIQDQKVLSGFDIHACAGRKNPLVISDIHAKVEGDEGLSIKLTGNPVVCGVCVRKSSVDDEMIKVTNETWKTGHHSLEDISEDTRNEEFLRLFHEHECQKKELRETKHALEELRRQNEIKTRECQDAVRSFRELQNELMRKSMHVGSLAFAIEGQVKEKSRWFSSLRDLTRKLKILKMDQMKLAEEALSYNRCFRDLDGISFVIQSKMKEYLDSHEDLKTKYIKGAEERRELYNKVLELKGNIRVFCRCRPLNAEEVAAGASMAVDFDVSKDGEVTVKSNGLLKKIFKFDAAFSPEAGQDEVFKDTAPFATSVLDGYNVCIFAYGQTGTGKTFTMEGTGEARGVNYRTLEELFHIIGKRKNTYAYDVSVSVMEVYNEQIRDLLAPETQSGQGAKRLEIKQVGEGMHHVPGLVEAHVNNMKEVWEVLKTGSNGRAVGSTSANEHSSRSHCIHCVMVKGENLLSGDCTKSKLWLIDLAGSERVAKTEVLGERLKETQNINRSLSALGDVISALASKSPHIPFRNSKLTHLLQDSLGGDSKTLMFVQISPNENDLSETLCSLNFASRVRGIELGPAKKQVESSELLKCKQLIEKTKQEAKSKDFQIKKLEDTVHALDFRIKERDVKSKNLQDKIKELEAQLLVERKLARQHIDTKIAEQHHTRQQLDEQTSARLPLATKTIGTANMSGENKDQLVTTHPLVENSSKLNGPALDVITKRNELAEKENIPATTEFFALPMPKRTGRASICPGFHRIPAAHAPRRNSLIPLPSSQLLAKLPSPVLPTIQAENTEAVEGVESSSPLEPPAPWDSPKEPKTGSKKLSSLLRKSVHRKKSPMQQYARRVGVNVGTEKVRLSIGSRGRMAQRVLGNARRVTKETQPKYSKKEKERGWNIGTVAARPIL